VPHLQIMYAQPTVIVFDQRCVGSSPESVWRYEESLICMITFSETFEIARIPTLDIHGVPICAVRRDRLTRQQKHFSETQGGNRGMEGYA